MNDYISTNRFVNGYPEDMEKFLETKNLTRLNHEKQKI